MAERESSKKKPWHRPKLLKAAMDTAHIRWPPKGSVTAPPLDTQPEKWTDCDDHLEIVNLDDTPEYVPQKEIESMMGTHGKTDSGIKSEDACLIPTSHPNVPDYEDDVVKLKHTIQKLTLERDRFREDKMTAEQRVSRYESIVAAKMPDQGLYTSERERIAELEELLQATDKEKQNLMSLSKEKEKQTTEEHQQRERELKEANEQDMKMKKQVDEAKSQIEVIKAGNRELKGYTAVQKALLETQVKDLQLKLGNAEIQREQLIIEKTKLEAELKLQKEQVEELKKQELVLVAENKTQVQEISQELNDAKLQCQELTELKKLQAEQVKHLEEEKEAVVTEKTCEIKRLIKELEAMKEQKEQLGVQLQDQTVNITTGSLSQSNDGAGASLSESDKKIAELTQELMEREEEVEKLKKELHNKISEVDSLNEKKLMHEQQLAHMVDHTALLAQQEEYAKAQQDMLAERRHYKSLEAQNVNLQQEIQELKQSLHHSIVSRQGDEESIDKLKQQLKQRDAAIEKLSQSSNTKEILLDETHVQSKGFVEQLEKIISQKDQKLIEEKESHSEQLKKQEREIESLKAQATQIDEAAKKTIQDLQEKREDTAKKLEEQEEICIELQNQLTKMQKEHDQMEMSLVTTKENMTVIQENSSKFQQLCYEKEQHCQKLQTQIGNLTVEYKAVIANLKADLSFSKEENGSLRDISESLRKDLEETYNQKDVMQKKCEKLEKSLDKCKEKLDAVQAELVTYEADLAKAEKALHQFQTEKVKNDQFLKKAEMKSFDEVIRSYNEKVERVKQMEEERGANEQQTRAYKRQVDTLKVKLDDLNEEKKKLEGRINSKEETKRELNEMTSKVYALTQEKAKLTVEKEKLNAQIHENAVDIENANTVIEKMRQANKVLQQKKAHEETMWTRELGASREMNIALGQELESFKNEHRISQQRLRAAWIKIDELQDEILALKTRQFPHGTRPQQHQTQGGVHSYVRVERQSTHDNQSDPAQLAGLPPIGHPITTNTSKMADRRIEEAKEARKQFEARKQSQLHVVTHQQQKRAPVVDNTKCQVEEGDIQENPIIHDIDKDIQGFAADVRKQTQPPQTQEFLLEEEDDDAAKAIPYDPNLTCQWCGKRYRFGEIQKLRRHVNEFCITYQYTKQQQQQ